MDQDRVIVLVCVYTVTVLLMCPLITNTQNESFIKKISPC